MWSRSILHFTMGLFVLLFFYGADVRGAPGYTGTWFNTEKFNQDLTRIDLTATRTQVSVQVWNQQGEIGQVIVPFAPETITAKVKTKLLDLTLTITLIGDNTLKVHAFFDYSGLGSIDRHEDYYFYRQGTPVKPDLTITDIRIDDDIITYLDTPWTWVHFTVKNIGPVPLTGASLRGTFHEVLRNGQPVPPSGYFTIAYTDPLMPGDMTEKSFAVGDTTYWGPSQYRIRVGVDDLDEIDEAQENNNVSEALYFDVVDEDSLVGTIEFNQIPIKDYTGVMPGNSVRVVGEGDYLDPAVYGFGYNPTNSRYHFSKLPDGEVVLSTTFIVNPTRWTNPGNFDTFNSVDMSTLHPVLKRDFTLRARQQIRLLSPWDNTVLSTHPSLPRPRFCSPVRFEWEPVDGTDHYSVLIKRYIIPENPDDEVISEVITNHDQTETSYLIDLIPHTDNERFQLTLRASDADDRTVGLLNLNFHDGFYVVFTFRTCAVCPIADLNRDCQVDFFDFEQFAAHWLDGVE